MNPQQTCAAAIRWTLRALAVMVVFVALSCLASDPDPLAGWRNGVSIRPVVAATNAHTMHAYFNTTPESPDGRWVVFYASTAADGQMGEVRIVERATGKETILAKNVTTEDAHRTACQQWANHGKQVVYHDVRNGEWLILAVDMATFKERVLAKGRQLGFGQGTSKFVPVYGPHWDPKAHRDFDLIDVETGASRTVVTAAAVKAACASLITSQFGERPISLFFPIVSPDAKRAFLKLATPSGGDFRSSQASFRTGMVVVELENGQVNFGQARWNHPAWHPESKTILEGAKTLTDAKTGKARNIEMVAFPGSHPAIDPRGEIFVTDTLLETFGGQKNDWGIAVGALRGKEFEMIHRTTNSLGGARSWRPSHPHPVFSPDGKRIYFNVNESRFSRLFVAEAGAAR